MQLKDPNTPEPDYEKSSESTPSDLFDNNGLNDPLMAQGVPDRKSSRDDVSEKLGGLSHVKPLDFQSGESDKIQSAGATELEPFMVPWYRMTWKMIFQELMKFFIFGISMSLNNAGNIIVIFINFLYIGALGDPLLEASFGLGVSYFSFFFWSLCLGCSEMTAIQCAMYYGKKDFHMMSVSLAHGFIFQSLVLAFSIQLFWFCGDILVAIDIAPDNAKLAGEMVRWMIPGIILQGINFQQMCFGVAQKIDKDYGISNLVGIVTCGCLCNWLVNDLKFGIYVFPICKMIFETINLLTNAWVFIFRIEKGSLKCIALKDVFTSELGTFLWLGLKIMSALYAEFLGFEANTYLAGITHDQDQISAFVSWVNITGIIYAFGLGFANVSRTTVSTYVGGGKSVQAKNSSYFYITWCAVLGFILLVVFPLNAENIADVYSPLERIKAWIRPILYVYAIGAMCEMVNGTQNTLLRVAGKTSTVVCIVVQVFLVLLVMVSYICAFTLGMGDIGLVLGFNVANVVCNVIFFFMIRRLDWSKVEVNGE